MTKIQNSKQNFWKILTFIFGAAFIANFFFEINLSIIPRWRLDSRSKDKAQFLKAKAAEIYKNLVCSCCGKSIADCVCGMAKERKAFVEDQIAQGLEKREIFKEAVKKYGEEILFDQALAADIKNELISEAPKERPIIAVEPENIDLGKVSMAKARVEIVFKLRNVGQSDLKILGMETSCGCTKAKLKVGDIESPEFGMGDNPTNWSTSLPPNQEAKILVTFDPGHHGEKGLGPATRTVSIRSNDPINPLKKVQFEVEVVR